MGGGRLSRPGSGRRDRLIRGCRPVLPGGGRFSGFIAVAIRKRIVYRAFASVHGLFPVGSNSWISIASFPSQFFLIIGFCTITLMGSTVSELWLK